jgi:hypothetical protein
VRVKRTLLVPLGGVVDRRRFVPVMLLSGAQPVEFADGCR